VRLFLGTGIPGVIGGGKKTKQLKTTNATAAIRFPAIVVGGVMVVTFVLLLVTAAASAVPFRADYPTDSITQDEGTRLTGSTTGEYMG
jgi:hypothetical protein